MELTRNMPTINGWIWRWKSIATLIAILSFGITYYLIGDIKLAQAVVIIIALFIAISAVATKTLNTIVALLIGVVAAIITLLAAIVLQVIVARLTAIPPLSFTASVIYLSLVVSGISAIFFTVADKKKEQGASSALLSAIFQFSALCGGLYYARHLAEHMKIVIIWIP